MRSMSVPAKLGLSVAVLGVAAAVAGLGTFGTFTSTTAAQTPTYSSGTVILDFGATGTTNRLSTGALQLAPGDTAERGFTLRNSGTLNFASETASVAATTSSLLDNSAGGMTMEIQGCTATGGWVESLSAPYTYTCASTPTSVLPATPVATLESSAQTLTSLTSLTAGNSDSLMATFTLPSTAGNSYQGLSSTLSLTFTATQRAGKAV